MPRKVVKPKAPWVATVTLGCSRITIGRQGSRSAPVLIYGNAVWHVQKFARAVADAMNQAKVTE